MRLCILIIRQKAVGVSQELSDHIDKGEFYVSDVQSKVKIATYAVTESHGKDSVKPYPGDDSETLEDVLRERSKNQICDVEFNRLPRTSLIYTKEKCPITHKTMGQKTYLENNITNSSDVKVNTNKNKRELPSEGVIYPIMKESNENRKSNSTGVLENSSQDYAFPSKELQGSDPKTSNLRNIFMGNVECNNSQIISALFEKLFQNLDRRKRKSGKKFVPRGLPSLNKFSRRSVPDKYPDLEVYSSKLQKMQKELSDLEKALSAPKAARRKNDDRNLTLQIRVIVDVVNNTFGQNDNAEEEQLNKRDTALIEKDVRSGHIEAVPIPLNQDSPLQEEVDKCTNIWRPKRVDIPVRNMEYVSKKGTEKLVNETPQHIIQNITRLLDTLLANHELLFNNACKNVKCLTGSSLEQKKCKRSLKKRVGSQCFLFETVKPFQISQQLDMEYAAATSTYKQYLCDLVTARKYSYNESVDDYAVSRYQDNSGILRTTEDESITESGRNNILIELNDKKNTGRHDCDRFRKRRHRQSVGNGDVILGQIGKKEIEDKECIFENEIKALDQIINSIKDKLAYMKINNTTIFKTKIRKATRNPTLKDNVTNDCKNKSTSDFTRQNEILINQQRSCPPVQTYKKVPSQKGTHKSKKYDDKKEILLQNTPIIKQKGHSLRERNKATVSKKMEQEIGMKSTVLQNRPKWKFRAVTQLPLDRGSKITIDWCCQGEGEVSDISSSDNTTMSYTTENVIELYSEITSLPTTLSLETKEGLDANAVGDSLDCVSTTHVTKKMRLRGDHCHHHHHKNHSLFREHKLTTRRRTTTSHSPAHGDECAPFDKTPSLKSTSKKHGTFKTTTLRFKSYRKMFRDLVKKNNNGLSESIDKAILPGEGSQKVVNCGGSTS